MKTSLERLKLTVKKKNKANMFLLSFIASSLVRRPAQTNHSKLADVSTNQDQKPKRCFVPVATASFPALGAGLHDLDTFFSALNRLHDLDENTALRTGGISRPVTRVVVAVFFFH